MDGITPKERLTPTESDRKWSSGDRVKLASDDQDRLWKIDYVNVEGLPHPDGDLTILATVCDGSCPTSWYTRPSDLVLVEAPDAD